MAREALSAAERELGRSIARTGGELRRDHDQVERCLSLLRHMTDNKAVAMKIVALEGRNEHLEAALRKLN